MAAGPGRGPTGQPFLTNLAKYQPKVISLDAIFSEPDQNINSSLITDIKTRYQTVAKQQQELLAKCENPEVTGVPDNFTPFLDQLQAQSSTDAIMAEALSKTNNVVFGWFYFQSDEDAQQATYEENLKRLELIKRFEISVIKYRQGASAKDIERAMRRSDQKIRGFQVNLPEFSDKLAGSGYFSVISDNDGIYREAYLISGWPPQKWQKNPDDFTVFPALDLETLRVYLDATPMITVQPYPLSVQEIKIGPYNIPVGENGAMLINYVGDYSKYEHYSFYDIYSDFAEQRKTGFDPEKAFKGKIALVGATATAIFDQRTTPLGTFPGISLHANIINNILHNSALYRPTWMWGFDLLAILVLGILISLIYPRLKPMYTTVLVILVVAGYLVVNYYVFDTLHISLTITYPVTSILVVFMGITLYHYTMEEKEKRFIRTTFSAYLSPAVMDDLMAHPEKIKLGGDNKRLTIFFSDIAGFTTISEKLPTERLVHLLNQYLTEMSDIVLNNRGTVDKYIGDAVMAFFGAPVDYPDHAASACLAALDMHEKLKELNVRWKQEGFPPVNCRIGLNTGEVKVGNMGSLKRMDFTVIGDEVNLASRLEGANKAYGTAFMISESTYQDAKDSIEARELDLLAVVGKQKPVRVYQVLARKGKLDPKMAQLVKIFHQGLVAYRASKFADALELFKKCLEISPSDSPSQVYLQRCQTYIETPPAPDWDGVWRLTKK